MTALSNLQEIVYVKEINTNTKQFTEYGYDIVLFFNGNKTMQECIENIFNTYSNLD